MARKLTPIEKWDRDVARNVKKLSVSEEQKNAIITFSNNIIPIAKKYHIKKEQKMDSPYQIEFALMVVIADIVGQEDTPAEIVAHMRKPHLTLSPLLRLADEYPNKLIADTCRKIAKKVEIGIIETTARSI